MNIAYIGLGVIFASSALLAIAPEQYARYQLWYHRKLFGARVADPGRGTFQLYRVIGILGMAIAFSAFTRSLFS